MCVKERETTREKRGASKVKPSFVRRGKEHRNYAVGSVPPPLRRRSVCLPWPIPSSDPFSSPLSHKEETLILPLPFSCLSRPALLRSACASVTCHVPAGVLQLSAIPLPSVELLWPSPPSADERERGRGTSRMERRGAEGEGEPRAIHFGSSCMRRYEEKGLARMWALLR